MKSVKEFGNIPILVIIARTLPENDHRPYSFIQQIKNYYEIIEKAAQQHNTIIIDIYKISESNTVNHKAL